MVPTLVKTLSTRDVLTTRSQKGASVTDAAALHNHSTKVKFRRTNARVRVIRARQRHQRYQIARAVAEGRLLVANRKDLVWDFSHGIIKVQRGHNVASAMRSVFILHFSYRRRYLSAVGVRFVTETHKHTHFNVQRNLLVAATVSIYFSTLYSLFVSEHVRSNCFF